VISIALFEIGKIYNHQSLAVIVSSIPSFCYCCLFRSPAEILLTVPFIEVITTASGVEQEKL